MAFNQTSSFPVTSLQCSRKIYTKATTSSFPLEFLGKTTGNPRTLPTTPALTQRTTLTSSATASPSATPPPTSSSLPSPPPATASSSATPPSAPQAPAATTSSSRCCGCWSGPGSGRRRRGWSPPHSRRARTSSGPTWPPWRGPGSPGPRRDGCSWRTLSTPSWSRRSWPRP